MNEEPPVTEAELARVAELDAKATQGPLRVGYDGPSRPIIISANMDEPMLSIGALSHGHSEPYEKEDADCELFAEYRTLTPRLARELAAARAAIKDSERQLKVLLDFTDELNKEMGCVRTVDFPKARALLVTLAQLNTHTYEH